jgi:multiple sugar transport system permease protein/putative aldouronate transport system permease protein
MIWTGYMNTFFYVIFGTLLHLVMTIALAYPLSRRNYQGKPFLIKFMTFSMLFGGGLIPTYILISNLHLVNTRTWMILSGAVGISHAIMMRTFFQSNIPEELLESAKMDGISDLGYLFKIVLPLSKAVISVICLYATVSKWNSYFAPMLYLQDREKYPLQLIVNELLNSTRIDTSQIQDQTLLNELANAVDSMSYALLVVSSAPMIILYPFVQKFFEKGVTIGSVKG